MTSRILILPDDVVNKVAAGEVVERPAAALKELCENSLDAGADRITVDLTGSGRTLIRVCDNGCGMTHDELLLALERHSTSKIRRAEDLEHIATLGFRGEALPSLASVSKMTVTTCPSGAREGTKATLDGGKILSVTPCGAPEGTEIEIRNLFRNIPARLKFLKSNATELTHCIRSVAGLALANPAVGFSLSHGGRRLLNLSPGRNWSDRLEQHVGAGFFNALIPFQASSGSLRLMGCVSRPGYSRPGIEYQNFFVNRRPVRDFILQKTLREGCRDFFHPGEQISFYIWIEIPSAEVDVNVHPTKREIRFRNLGAIKKVLVPALREALRQDKRSAIGPVPPSSSPGREASVNEELVAFRPGSEAAAQMDLAVPAIDETRFLRNRPETLQLFGTYLVLVRPEGLLLVDQHAAHERILYEKVLSLNNKPDSQRLLQPLSVDLSPGEAEILLEALQPLSDIGVDVEAAGTRSFRILALPADLPASEAPLFIRDLLARLQDGKGLPDVHEFRKHAAALIACHGSVRANQKLGAEEVEALLSDLFKAENPSTCPHGRPTFITLDHAEIKRRFKRT